jgi:D-beta-D-heptose 7-phosphate kinase/D-beta-D-heptose 1-phosphate adenosyltransferase
MKPILVVGDVMIDRTYWCDHHRVDQTAPVPVGHVTRQTDLLGGAGHVAVTLAKWGIPVHLMAIAGFAEQELIKRELSKYPHNATCDIVGNINTQSTIKNRVMNPNGHLVARFDIEAPYNQHGCAAELQRRVDRKLHDWEYAVAVLSDYGKGAYTGALWNSLLESRIPVIADPCGSADLYAYSDATVLKPNEREAEQMIGDNTCFDRKELAVQFQIDTGCEYAVMTAGTDGIYLVDNDGDVVNYPAVDTLAADTNGAGDVVTAALAMGYYFGWDLYRAVEFATVAAGVAVQQPGTDPVSLTRIVKHPHWSPEQKLRRSVAWPAHVSKAAHQSDEKVVVANGIFDLPHPGHRYLMTEAAKQGDMLIVLMNSDASAGRVKPGRPVLPWSQRAELVASWPEVAMVVEFDEDTPETIIQDINPHVLVKGGDTEGNIPGAEYVQTQGGELHIVEIKEDLSTTDIIRRARQI